MEPKSELERQVQAVWQEVLAQDAISVTSDFFHLGGTSLRVLPIPACVLIDYTCIHDASAQTIHFKHEG